MSGIPPCPVVRSSAIRYGATNSVEKWITDSLNGGNNEDIKFVGETAVATDFYKFEVIQREETLERINHDLSNHDKKAELIVQLMKFVNTDQRFIEAKNLNLKWDDPRILHKMSTLTNDLLNEIQTYISTNDYELVKEYKQRYSHDSNILDFYTERYKQKAKLKKEIREKKSFVENYILLVRYGFKFDGVYPGIQNLQNAISSRRSLIIDVDEKYCHAMDNLSKQHDQVSTRLSGFKQIIDCAVKNLLRQRHSYRPLMQKMKNDDPQRLQKFIKIPCLKFLTKYLTAMSQSNNPNPNICMNSAWKETENELSKKIPTNILDAANGTTFTIVSGVNKLFRPVKKEGDTSRKGTPSQGTQQPPSQGTQQNQLVMPEVSLDKRLSRICNIDRIPGSNYPALKRLLTMAANITAEYIKIPNNFQKALERATPIIREFAKYVTNNIERFKKITDTLQQWFNRADFRSLFLKPTIEEYLLHDLIPNISSEILIKIINNERIVPNHFLELAVETITHDALSQQVYDWVRSLYTQCSDDILRNWSVTYANNVIKAQKEKQFSVDRNMVITSFRRQYNIKAPGRRMAFEHGPERVVIDLTKFENYFPGPESTSIVKKEPGKENVIEETGSEENDAANTMDVDTMGMNTSSDKDDFTTDQTFINVDLDDDMVTDPQPNTFNPESGNTRETPWSLKPGSDPDEKEKERVDAMHVELNLPPGEEIPMPAPKNQFNNIYVPYTGPSQDPLPSETSTNVPERPPGPPPPSPPPSSGGPPGPSPSPGGSPPSTPPSSGGRMNPPPAPGFNPGKPVYDYQNLFYNKIAEICDELGKNVYHIDVNIEPGAAWYIKEYIGRLLNAGLGEITRLAQREINKYRTDVYNYEIEILENRCKPIEDRSMFPPEYNVSVQLTAQDVKSTEFRADIKNHQRKLFQYMARMAAKRGSVGNATRMAIMNRIFTDSRVGMKGLIYDVVKLIRNCLLKITPACLQATGIRDSSVLNALKQHVFHYGSLFPSFNRQYERVKDKTNEIIFPREKDLLWDISEIMSGILFRSHINTMLEEFPKNVKFDDLPNDAKGLRKFENIVRKVLTNRMNKPGGAFFTPYTESQYQKILAIKTTARATKSNEYDKYLIDEKFKIIKRRYDKQKPHDYDSVLNHVLKDIDDNINELRPRIQGLDNYTKDTKLWNEAVLPVVNWIDEKFGPRRFATVGWDPYFKALISSQAKTTDPETNPPISEIGR